MAIRLTGGVNLDALIRWCGDAEVHGNTECEIYVNRRGWILRAPGVPDFIIEPDDWALSGDLE